MIKSSIRQGKIKKKETNFQVQKNPLQNETLLNETNNYKSEIEEIIKV